MAGGNDSFTKVLLHFDGSDASTTITDDNAGGSAHTWTALGNAQIDTAQSKSGGGSLLLDGTGDGVSTPDTADTNLAASEFALDCWVRFNALPTGTVGAGLGMVFASHWGNLSRGWLWGVEKNGSNYRLLFSYNAAATTLVGSDFALSTDTWYHFATTRDNTSTDTLRFFLDGSGVGSSTSINGVTILNSTHTPIVGSYDTLSFSNMNGWIDEFRLSVGTPRWTADFTSSAAPYSRIAPVVHSYRMRRAA